MYFRFVTSVLLLCLTIGLQGCRTEPLPLTEPPVTTGAQVLLNEHLDELSGKRVGLVMNPTARVEGAHMLDTLLASGVNVTALFAPEHGFRGDAGAGETIEEGVDQATGLPVYSLYGSTKKPSPEMLGKVDLLLFDMQDVGARFYTYNVTLGNIIEAAASQQIPVWVLDRPNPAGGDYISGWMLQPGHKSFVGAYPIPMIHGMTLGELARMMVGEQWIANAEQAQLKVIPMNGWERAMRWPDTGLHWTPPSPNLPTFEHAFVYLGTVLFEGVTISEGRGTPDPFLTIGAPGTELTMSDIAELRGAFSGVSIERISFTPHSIPGKSAHPDFEDEECHGIELQVTDPDAFDPLRLGVKLFKTILEATPDAQVSSFIEKLTGIDRSQFLQELNEGSYTEHWQQVTQHFRKQRKPYLIYD